MAIDSYRFLDFGSRQVMKAWASRQKPGVIPFTPLAKPLRECTVALVSTAGVARNEARFSSKGEKPIPGVKGRYVWKYYDDDGESPTPPSKRVPPVKHK